MATNRVPNHLPHGYNPQIVQNQYQGPPIPHVVYGQPTYYQPIQIQNNNNQVKALSPQPQMSRQFFDQYAQPNRVLSPPPILQTGYPGYHQNNSVQHTRGNQSRQSRSDHNRQGQRNSEVHVIMNDLNDSMQKKEVVSEKPKMEEANMPTLNTRNQMMAPPMGYPQHIYPQQLMHPQQAMYPPQYHVNYIPQGQFQMKQMAPNNYYGQAYNQNYPGQEMQPQEQYYYYEGQDEEGEDPNDPMVWNRRFFFIFERFEWAYERCELLKTDYEEVHEQLKTVDSEQDWNALKEKHEQLLQKFMQFQEEMAGVITENQQFLQQRPQSGEQVWAQRYQQLLENYKGLKQQMENRQNEQVGSGHDTELSRQFRDLKVQYTKIFNQYKELKRKETREQGQKQEILQKLDEVMQENEKCKAHIEKMNQSYDEMSNAFQQLQVTNINLKREIASKPKVDKNQYDRFMIIVSEKDSEISQMRRELANRENQRYMMQEQLSIQSNQVSSLKGIVNRLETQTTSGIREEYNRVIAIKNEEIQQYRKMLKSIEEDYQLRMEAMEEEVRRQNQEAINQLQNEISQLRQKIQESQNTHQLKMNSSEKKITIAEQQATGLHQVINQKNQQIMQLRSLTYELDNYKTLQKQCSDLNDEKIQFLNTIKAKDKQIEELKASLEAEKAQLRETFDRKVEINTRSIKQQLNQLKEIIKIKDNQIQKVRSLQQTKQKKISQLQIECDVQRSKNISLQRNFQNQRDNFRKQIRVLETRNNDLDRKVRHLEFDFGESVKTSLQSQISTLRSQSHAKQQVIGKLQNSQIELRGRISHLERQKKDLQLNLQELKSKSKDFSQHRAQLTRKIDGLINDVHSRDRIIKTLQLHEQNYKNQLGKLKNQIVENQNTIKIKSSVIEDLQRKTRKDSQSIYQLIKEKDSLKLQINKSKEESDSTIRGMKEQLQQYDDLINSGRLSKELEMVNNQNLQMISSLRLENDKLKKQLTRGYDAEASRVSVLDSSKGVKGGEGLSFIQKRLFDFNSKLQSMITQDDPKNSKGNNKQNYSQNLNNQYKDEIKSLKGKLAELQNYCSALQVRVGDQIFQTSAQNTVVFAEQQRIVKQQIQFHKSQTKQFQDRIESLLKVNRQLKTRLDAMLKSNVQNSAISYYKQQLQHSDKNIENMNQKLNKLVDQNRSLRSELANLGARFSKQYTQKNFDTDSKIDQLVRKVRLLELQKVSAANQRATLMHQISQYQSDIEIIKSNLGQKITTAENINEQLSMKIQRYENEIRQLSQRQNA